MVCIDLASKDEATEIEGCYGHMSFYSLSVTWNLEVLRRKSHSACGMLSDSVHQTQGNVQVVIQNRLYVYNINQEMEEFTRNF